MPTASRNVLCLGEALVDLICERPAGSLEEADMFVPHFGGAVASVALMAARAGGRTALAGGVGDDDWGRWLRGQLERAGVGLDHFKLIEDMPTPLTLTTVDGAGEPTFRLYGDAAATVVNALWGGVEEAVASSGGLFISSDTLVGEAERKVTMQARELTLELGHPVIFDPHLRLARWSSKVDAAASANACVPGSLLVHVKAAEARLMTGEEDLERAAMALRKAGARNVVITTSSPAWSAASSPKVEAVVDAQAVVGAQAKVDAPAEGPLVGAMLRGKIRADVPALPARVISRIGARDALMATLLARLQITGFYEPAIAAALKEAMVISAQACERWGACD